MCTWGTTEPVVINGKPRSIDSCLVPIIRALNDCGAATIACCCGHGKHPGNIILADGREIFIAPDFATARAVDKAFPPINESPKERST